VFLGRDQGLAILATDGDLPLMWRPFGLPVGGEADAILAAVASVRTPGIYCGLESDINAVMIHGRPDLEGLAELATKPALKGVRTLRHDGPALDEREIALGLALRPSHQIEPFNLIRSFAPPARFREIFPWGQALIHAAVLLAATILLQNRLASGKAEAANARSADARCAWAASVPTEKLRVEKKGLEQRDESIRTFLASRTIWTNYARDLAGRLPPDLALTSILGVHELETSDSRGVKPKHSLTLRLNAPIPRTGAMPREIDAFLRTLRDDPLLRRDFARIELADLRWSKVSAGASSASFSVVCQPMKAPTKAAPSGEPKGRRR
jgi:hypothetical protein